MLSAFSGCCTQACPVVAQPVTARAAPRSTGKVMFDRDMPRVCHEFFDSHAGAAAYQKLASRLDFGA
jgi:hypothetical protein